jgi:zinc protease
MSAASRQRASGWALAGALAILASCCAAEPDALGSVFLPAPDDPLVHFRVLIKTGSADDPSGKDGLSRMTWELMAEGGTRTSTATEIAARLYPLAAAVSVSVDEEASVFSADVSADNLEAFYAIFREMLLAPGFPAEDLELRKAVRLARLEIPADEGELRALSLDVLDRLIYEEHPYGRPATGTAKAISGFTTADARVFYGQHFVRGNIVLGLAGGYPPEFAERVLADLRTLPSGFTPALRLPAPKRQAGPEVLIAERPGAGEAAAMGIALLPGLTEPEAAALKIAAVQLGQDRDVRLMPDRFRRQRIFLLPIAPGAEADPLLDVAAALDSLRTLVRDGIPQDRFDLIQTSLLNGARLAAGGAGERLRERVDALAPPGEEDERTRARTILAGLTRDDIGRAVRKHLDPERAAIAIVTGDAEAVRSALAAIVPGASVRILPAEDAAGPAPETIK